jgi:8-oxo-dGTP pyrophosphatase MutT (NUDIX family)
VVVDPSQRAVLLVDHRKAQLWLPTGGHVEPGEHPRTTVRREAAEELGVDARFLQASGARPLLLTSALTVGLTAGHTDVSLWYAIEGDVEAGLRHDPGRYPTARSHVGGCAPGGTSKSRHRGDDTTRRGRDYRGGPEKERHVSAAELHKRLRLLQLERLEARDIGLTECEIYRRDLEREMAACHAAYVGAVVTELATLRGEIFGRGTG